MMILRRMRCNLISLGKLYTKYPKDPFIKGRNYRNYRLYNKSRKVKYKQFMNSMLQKLDGLGVENPKQYWQLINDIRGLKKDNSSSLTEGDVWLRHFQILHSVTENKFKSRIKELEEILGSKEKSYIFNELDFEINNKEIYDAISTLKSGKANCSDLISNEMSKNSQKHMVPCLRQLFNLCLLNGIYPKIWADGYITPI